MPRTNRRPIGVVVAGAASLLMFLALSILSFPDGFEWLPNKLSESLPQPAPGLLPVGALLSLGALVAIFARKRFAPALTVAALVGSGAMLNSVLTRAFFEPGVTGLGQPVPTSFASRIAAYGFDFSGSLLFTVVLLAFSVLAAALLGSTRTRNWFVGQEEPRQHRLAVVGRVNMKRPWTFLPLLVGPLCLFVAFPLIAGAVAPLVQALSDWPKTPATVLLLAKMFTESDPVLLGGLYALLFTAAAFSFRFRSDSEGVAVCLGERWKVLHARWERIRFIDVAQRGDITPSLTIHYRSRLGLPCSISLRAKALEHGSELIRTTLSECHSRDIATRTWQIPAKASFAGWTAILVGVALIAGGQLWSNRLMGQVTDGLAPEQLASVAMPIPLAVLHVVAVLIMGIGIGMLAARSNGTGSALVLAAWLLGTQVVPSPMLHWLVWIAIAAIYSAILQPVQPVLSVPSVPGPMEWEIAFLLVGLTVVFAGLGYVLGVMAGRRPFTLIRRPVAVAELEPQVAAVGKAKGLQPQGVVPSLGA